jgi:hypothetical protein
MREHIHGGTLPDFARAYGSNAAPTTKSGRTLTVRCTALQRIDIKPAI